MPGQSFRAAASHSKIIVNFIPSGPAARGSSGPWLRCQLRRLPTPPGPRLERAIGLTLTATESAADASGPAA